MSLRAVCLLAALVAPVAATYGHAMDGHSHPPDEEEASYAFGFLLASVAGAATVLGVAFIPLGKVFDRNKVVAGSLAFAAGVMIWVGFMEAFAEEGRDHFEEFWHHGPGHKDHDDHGHDDHRNTSASLGKHQDSMLSLFSTATSAVGRRLHGGPMSEDEFAAQWLSSIFFFVGAFVTLALDKLSESLAKKFAPKVGELQVELGAEAATRTGGSFSAPAGDHDHGHGHGHPHLNVDQGLAKVSIVAFLALTLHNFPEGFTTLFGGATRNFGIVIAIAMHNIPEGAAVAVPCYEACGRKYGPPLLACGISALAQPIGAGLGWILVEATGFKEDDFLFGVVFSMVGGIMVSIAILNLIPEALGLQNSFFVALWVFAGFAVMEGTLIFWSALTYEVSEGHSHD